MDVSQCNGLVKILSREVSMFPLLYTAGYTTLQVPLYAYLESLRQN